ncbi:basic leucine-zipper 42 [Hibiscus trionum]|uniref:Basic leucine-zipper 42 n=1 Tax=Hibiscus trionum TaxID=183268 RepID=A0A9W7LQV9_HIBTR|nr:basic leucine-zipper 42 [Hibiscus trionum]
MQPSEISGLRYMVPSNPSSYSAPTFDLSRFSNPLHNLYIPCVNSNSTSDEADEQQLCVINERKQRRMISNRESARRSRMRKQRHLDELWSQVVWLRNENHQLIDKLNHVSESHDKAVQENAQLKEEASQLRQLLSDMRLTSPYSTLRDLEHALADDD